jgi:hypothetical protein
MSKMRCSSVVHLAYLQTYKDLFCLSKNIDSEERSTIRPKIIDDDFVIEDEVLFAGESEEYFLMKIIANDYYRFFEIFFEIPITETDKMLKLVFANEANLEISPAAICLNDIGDKYLIQSRTFLTGYGLVIENNDEPDNHSGFFYAVETAKEQILAVARMSTNVVRELNHLGWIANHN